MTKKILCLSATIGFCLFLFPPSALAQFGAEDITVPPGYKVVKIAETNKVYDPYRITFDSSGHLFVAGYGYLIYDLDPDGRVSVIGKTRKHNITPLEIEISPSGSFVMRANHYPPGESTHYAVLVFTPPDTYTIRYERGYIGSIGYDKLGNFYSVLRDPVPDTNPVQYIYSLWRCDSNFAPIERVFSGGTNVVIRDFVFDGQNNLYFFTGGAFNTTVAPWGIIWRLSAGGDGIPGPADSRTILADSLYAAPNMAIDQLGNIYVDEYLGEEIDGYSWYQKQRLTKIDPSGLVTRDAGPTFANSSGLACRGGALYVSEFDRGVISKVDLATFQKSAFSGDTGIDAPGPIAWDNGDTLYTGSFRQQRILKLNPGGAFTQLGPGTGTLQSIAFDGADFYIGSAGGADGIRRILKIDPATGGQTPIAENVAGYRTVAFDSFGRLILNIMEGTDENQNRFGAGIIDLMTGTTTPYLTGIHNKGRCIRFDSRQNIYFVEGNGDGIKKIALAPAYSPAWDVSAEALTYDFVIPGFASPTIYFFAVNPLEELFVPRMDSGDVLFCDPAGGIGVFARGFIWPTHAAVDKYGSLYISDASSGIFKIFHERWTIPAVIKLKDALLSEVKSSAIDMGVRNSLVQKLENADKDLEGGRVTPAIAKIDAFVNEVLAQSGKKVPADLAARWVQAAQNIVKALKEVE